MASAILTVPTANETIAQSNHRSLFWMLLIGLILRLTVMSFVYPERIDPYRDHWQLGGEGGRIARSIAQGQGFSNPLFGNTGSTAWLGPVYPYLLAGIFKLFGIYSNASAFAAMALNCLFSAVTCIPVYLIARKHFGDPTATWVGWAWAFFPYSIFFAADFIWATTLTTLLMTLIFLTSLYIENSSSILTWACFGGLSGIGALADPIVMSVAPFLGAWACYRLYKNGGRWFVSGLAGIFAVTLIVSPWFIRNYKIFHKFIPIRSCLGLEIYCGNNQDSWHWDPPGYHPSDNESEWREYQQLGETAYISKKLHEGMAFIGSHKLLYARQTLRRVVYLWTGFWSFSPRYLQEEPEDPYNMVFCTALTILTLAGLRRAWQLDRSIAMPYIIVVLFFPMIYYFTHPEDYYRRPIDPQYVVLAAYTAASWAGKRKRQFTANRAVAATA